MRLTFVVLALFAASGVASAADFVFTVPVRIENLRFADRVTVGCNVFDRRGSPTGPIGRSGDVPVTLSGGSFRGVISVSVTLDAGYLRSDAGMWICGLTYHWPRPPGSRSISAGDWARFYQTETGQAIASSRLSRWGDAPH